MLGSELGFREWKNVAGRQMQRLSVVTQALRNSPQLFSEVPPDELGF